MSNPSSVTVTTAVTAIYTQPNPWPVLIYNAGSNPLYVGNTALVSATGYAVPAGGTAIWEADQPLYGIATGGSTTVQLAPHVQGKDSTVAASGGIPATAFTAKGMLLAGTGNGTYAGLAVGANNTALIADSTQTTGLAYAAVLLLNPAAGNSQVLQMGAAGDKGLQIRQFVGGTGNPFEIQSSGGGAVFSVASGGQIATTQILLASAGNMANANNTANAILSLPNAGPSIGTAIAANVALTVNNSNAAPTGKLQSWQATGVEVAYITSTGQLVAPSAGINGLGGLSVGNGATINVVSTSGIPIVSNGFAGQTAKLQSWRVNAVEQSYITATGRYGFLAANTATTVGAVGAASALPALPLGYRIDDLNGTPVKIPYYNA